MIPYSSAFREWLNFGFEAPLLEELAGFLDGGGDAGEAEGAFRLGGIGDEDCK